MSCSASSLSCAIGTNSELKGVVCETYSQIAENPPTRTASEAIAKSFGYSEEELKSIPAQANMGLSCGNPNGIAQLQEGERVLDIGSGGGLDVFLASKKVGPTGKAVGVDFSQSMIDLARRNAAISGLTNVEFHCASMEALPFSDFSFDCVTSNCVINLSTDKLKTMREIHRVLKPGGRVAISDIAFRTRDIPAHILQDVTSYVGCIAGAIEITEYSKMLESVGFENVEVTDLSADLGIYQKNSGFSCCAPNKSPLLSLDVNSFATSVKITAKKPIQ